MIRSATRPARLAILLCVSACFDKPDEVGTGDGTETGSGSDGSATSTEDTSTTATTLDGSSGGGTCGDGTVDPGEACDDANADPGDGCEPDCSETPGFPQWTITKDGPGHWEDWIEGIAIDPDTGDIVVVGNLAKAEGNRDHWIARFDRDGNEIWSETADPSDGLSDALYAVVVAPDGTLVVAGGVGRPDFAPDQPNADVFVGARDPGGAVLWSITHDVDGGWDQAGGVDLRSDGTVVVAATATVGGGLDAWVGAFEPSVEAPLWTRAHDGSAASTDFAEAIAVGAGDSIYVVGSVAELDMQGMTSPNDILVLGLSPQGELAWSRALDGDGYFDFGHALAVGDEGIFVAGTFGTDMMGSTTDLVIAHYDTIGNLAWSSRWGAGGGNHGNAVAVDGLSRAWVAGGAIGDILVARWDGEGEPAWTDVVDGRAGGTDFGSAIAVAADGSVVVGGRVDTLGANSDAWLRRYAPVP